MIITHVQQVTYPPKIVCLHDSGHVNKSSPIRKLMPVIYQGMIVVGGRLHHASMNQASRHPLLLPGHHVVSHLIARECHEEAHMGIEYCLCKLRQRYWITGARQLIKGITRQCMLCKHLYAGPLAQSMYNLQPECCEAGKPPFTFIGLDVFGPFYVKVGRASVKRYGCLFSCFSTRAIHLEVLHNMETDTFINALIRFISRRGNPKKVWSDNGTNIVGAKAELARSLRQLDRAKVISAVRRLGNDWNFNRPHASHQGGVWERMIRTVRNDDALMTLFFEVECLVNGRPIIKASDDVNDFGALTPIHLLMARGCHSLPWGNFELGETYRRRWKFVQHLATQF